MPLLGRVTSASTVAMTLPRQVPRRRSPTAEVRGFRPVTRYLAGGPLPSYSTVRCTAGVMFFAEAYLNDNLHLLPRQGILTTKRVGIHFEECLPGCTEEEDDSTNRKHREPRIRLSPAHMEGWGTWGASWIWSLVLVAITIAIHVIGVVLIANAIERIRTKLVQRLTY